MLISDTILLTTRIGYPVVHTRSPLRVTHTRYTWDCSTNHAFGVLFSSTPLIVVSTATALRTLTRLTPLVVRQGEWTYKIDHPGFSDFMRETVAQQVQCSMANLILHVLGYGLRTRLCL